VKNLFVLFVLVFLTIFFTHFKSYGGEIFIDELNGTTYGNAFGITYVETPNGKGALFRKEKESRIQFELDTFIPREGTIELVMNIELGYNYSNYVLSESTTGAPIFNTYGPDVFWPGGSLLAVYSNGDIIFSTITNKYDSDNRHVTKASGTDFKFNEWHSVGISYGSQGQYIMLDGQLVASEPNNNLQLDVGGDHSSQTGIPTIGEYASVFWENNQNEGGFEGIIDRLRVSDIQKDWFLSHSQDSTAINEREALIELFNQTNGNSWNNNNYWLGDPGTECTWYGIICDDSNYVKAIHLFNNNLNGTIPNSIKNLKHLQSLLLHGNLLIGSIPKEILQIETLESITLNDNNFSNNIISLMNQTIQDELNKPKKIDIKDAIYALQVVSGQYNIVNEPLITNTLGMTFTLIPSGTFIMGSPENEIGHESDEKQYTVTISKPFYIQTTEVTQEQWVSVMENNPSYFSSCGNNCPVENISWDDIQTFLSKLNAMGDGHYSLPTEAQWEYAARAGSTTSLPNGELIETGCAIDPQLSNIAWYCGNSESKTHPVAQKQPNAWGLYDIPGNVWEWCQDWYDNYPSTSVIDPVGPLSGSQRVIRDCGYDSNAVYCRSANRVRNYPDVKSKFFGIRLLKEL